MDIDNFLANTKNVYEHLADKTSRMTYNNRVMYSLTSDMQYIRDMIEELYPKIKTLNNKKLFIFGCGVWGQIITKTWSNLNWINFVDNDDKKWGTHINGLKVISPDDLVENLGEGYICISSRLYYKEIEKAIINLKIPKKAIFNFGKIIDDFSNEQYFNLSDLQHVKDEVFVDVGSFDGKTSLNFINWSNNEYEHIYAFEPDTINRNKMEKIFHINNNYSKVDIIPKCAWNCHTTLKFYAINNGFSSIAKSGDINVPATTLDYELARKRTTFIKMDIEGAELNAIKGAEKIICEQKPKLAISLYYKRKDILDIPDLLLSYNPEYKFYLRHYSLAAYETVLYAI